MYLLFIALVFIYVPSDFLDSINDTNRSFEKTAEELSELKESKFIMFEKTGFGVSFKNLTDSFKYRLISGVSDTAFNRIERLKNFLIEETGGLNKYGYPAKSKEFDIIDHLMLNSNRASNLKSWIVEYKKEIRPYLSDGQETILDSILVIKEEIQTSKGKLIPWEKFYFKKTPLSVTQMMLSKFQSEIRLVEYLVLDKYERDFLKEVFIKSGIATAKNEEENIADGKSLILRKNKPYYRVGEEIEIEPTIEGVPADSLNSKNLTANFKVGDFVEEAQVGEDGTIKFTPKTSGEYTVNADFKGQSSTSVDISVFNPKPVINREDLEVLYLGIRNPLRIEAENLDASTLIVSSDEGQIRKINDLYYAKFSKVGEVTITVEADVNGEKIHVNSRKFNIRELPLPYATLNSLRSGEIVDANMKKQRKLFIESDLYNTDDFYNVKQFRLTRISGDRFEVNQLPRVNRTANFGPSTIEMVNKAQKGDLFVFDEIVVIGANGKEYELQALAFKVI
jgi:gliding motility-associated protein GldM